MTRKEQNKILNDKIEANNAQHSLDRMNAEISAYSSGDLPKYEYLTKKDLNYKPNAFEQAKFECSALGKVFIDGLDKSDKKEGILKRLKNIEDKSNNQLLALRDIKIPKIRGRNDDDDDDDYKIIVNDYKNNKIDYKNIEKELHKINKRIDFYGKNKETFEKIPMYKNQADKDKKDAKILKRIVNEILLNKIIKKHTIKKVIDISWIDNTELFNKISNDVTSRYNKNKDSFELLSIQKFLDNINNEHIKNKKDAYKNFKDLKNNVKSKELKDIVKDLERAIFGYDYENEELSGSGLTILTNKQMLNYLPILLAQIEAGNTSAKLKNEARQILYSLYRSKILTKTVYNNLIRAIRV